MKDFTHKIYKELLLELIAKGYRFVTVEEYFKPNFNSNLPFILMRHDVDRRANSSLEMAKLEHSLGIKSTYYFRTISKTLKPEIIKSIANLGHEIGYHYESLAQTNGDYKKAIDNFEKNLLKLNKNYPIKSITMHGRPTSKWDSRLLWDRYDYKKYGILSEPYFDLDFNEILYISDAGRAWANESVNLRDKVESQFKFLFKHTDEIISNIKQEILPKKIMINIHPEHWAKTAPEWHQIWLIRKIKNSIKKILIRGRV